MDSDLHGKFTFNKGTREIPECGMESVFNSGAGKIGYLYVKPCPSISTYIMGENLEVGSNFLGQRNY